MKSTSSNRVISGSTFQIDSWIPVPHLKMTASFEFIHGDSRKKSLSFLLFWGHTHAFQRTGHLWTTWGWRGPGRARMDQAAPKGVQWPSRSSILTTGVGVNATQLICFGRGVGLPQAQLSHPDEGGALLAPVSAALKRRAGGARCPRWRLCAMQAELTLLPLGATKQVSNLRSDLTI